MTSENRVIIAGQDKKQDVNIIIPIFAVPRKLIQRYKNLSDYSSQVYSLVFHIFHCVSKPNFISKLSMGQ